MVAARERRKEDVVLVWLLRSCLDIEHWRYLLENSREEGGQAVYI
jgi:hypothetical protein